ncbi:transcription factor MYB44-like protein, partial [Tanacetum coccineum]
MASSSTTSQASVTSCIHRKLYQRKLWTPDEDAMLLKHIDMHGDKHWNPISEKLPARPVASCRKRWR